MGGIKSAFGAVLAGNIFGDEASAEQTTTQRAAPTTSERQPKKRSGWM